MSSSSYTISDNKVVIRFRDRSCDTSEELLTSRLFKDILTRCIHDLAQRRSRLLNIFGHTPVTEQDIALLINAFLFLIKLPADLVIRLLPEAEILFRDRSLLNDFVEHFYNYWRSFERIVILEAIGDRFDKRPYRTFNNTVETLMHVIRSTYRDLQENITGVHPKIFRQVGAGAEIGAIALPKNISLPDGVYQVLSPISMLRQVLIYPPLILNPPMNKRTGVFERVYSNPLEQVPIRPSDWLCYPARVGELFILIYFSTRFFELGFSLSNLFDLADDEDLKRKPDAIYLYGVPAADFRSNSTSQTIFFDDEENDVLIAAIPDKKEFGYFGYLKKMALTLHNICMMKKGKLPFHGALVNISLHDHGSFSALIFGDTGAGKSETLEALRTIGSEKLGDIIIIADDMGSLTRTEDGVIRGYGTEIGAFVRLDDLQPGYAYGQIDRTIIMSPSLVNARVVLPVTTFDQVIKGYPIDLVLYANNYETIDDDHPIYAPLDTWQEALEVFRAGKVMSKGTTTSSGLVQTYFANVFGPTQYQDLHEKLAEQYFKYFYELGIPVGQLRTQLGIPGKERSGPELAARELLSVLERLR
ncbi:MAG TPA: hypothetical protein VIO61_17665 [Anaerolineaceae bacterium]